MACKCGWLQACQDRETSNQYLLQTKVLEGILTKQQHSSACAISFGFTTPTQITIATEIITIAIPRE
eukprot:138390-Amphidinium_carterae.1